jgi:hypothetical protein
MKTALIAAIAGAALLASPGVSAHYTGERHHHAHYAARAHHHHRAPPMAYYRAQPRGAYATPRSRYDTYYYPPVRYYQESALQVVVPFYNGGGYLYLR